MSDKPLHVQVAEALGWHGCHYDCEALGWNSRHDEGDEPGWFGLCPGIEIMPQVMLQVPRYDTDWSETGPLIEKYQITLIYDPDPRCNPQWRWEAYIGWKFTEDANNCDHEANGPTALIAVCTLLLVLKEAGKLE